MRGTVNMISRTVAMILAFVMGFLIMASFVVGGGYIVYTQISIGMLETIGLIPIDLDDHFEEDAEVPVDTLTLSGLVGELVMLLQDKSKFTINTMTERYGIKFTEKIPDYVTEEYRNMPITELMQKSTLKHFAATTLIGDIYEYERIDNPDYNSETDDGAKYIWYDGDNKIEGFHSLICSITVEDLLFGDASDFVSDFRIADALSLKAAEGVAYYLIDGENRVPIDNMQNPITVWKDGNGVPVSGVINALAEFKVSDLNTKLDTLTVGDMMSLVSYNGVLYGWSYEASSNSVLLTTRDDVTVDLAKVTLKEISDGNLTDATKDIRLSAVMGYTKDADDNWYDSNGQKLDGIMASIAPYKVGEIDSQIGTLKIGTLAGYEEAGGKWYVYNDESSEEATGILASIADLTVDEVTHEDKLSEAIQGVTVADIMGYHKGADNEWYDKSDKKITGFMKVIAASPLNNAANVLDNADMAEILGYTTTVDENGKTVYLGSDGEPVHILMQKIAATKFADVSSVTDNLTVADIITEEDRATGFISLLDETTPLDSVSSEVNRIFNETKVCQFVDKGIIVVDDEHKQFYTETSTLGKMTLNELLQHMGDLSLQQ